MKRHYISLLLFFIFLLFSNNILYSQKAGCKKRIKTNTSPWACTAIINPTFIDSLSVDYDKLTLSEYSIPVGEHTVKLFALKDGFKTDSCETRIKVYENLNVFGCFFGPYKIHMKSKAPLKLNPNLFSFHASHCYDYNVTLEPEFVYCTDPAYKQVIITVTREDGVWWQSWADILIVRDNKDICDQVPDFPDNGDNISLDEGSNLLNGRSYENDQLVKQEYYDLYGRMIKQLHNEESLRTMMSGFYIIKSFYKSGKEITSKVWLSN